ncbi:MAG: rod shape-determining protein RodA [Deltaproteobacteria bacterium]|nr:rod shape-determining protein RodA [Deltaproteobacteria bacterium]
MIQDERSNELRSRGGQMDWPLVLVTTLLCAMGLVTLYSAAGSPLVDGPPRAFVMQASYMVFGLVLMLVLALLDPRVYERGAYLSFGVVVVLLLLVLLVGPVRGGSQRWLALGPVNLQPSELAKLALVVATARYFASRPRAEGWGLRDLLVPAALFLAPLALLVFLEPDLGTTLFLCFVFAAVTFVVGLRWRTLMVALVVVMLGSPIAYRVVLNDYQRERVDVLFAPDADPKGQGYQAIQGRYAIGSGQVLGKGFGNSTQGRLRFLPEQHTDFIFSVFAEERGFVGCVLVLLLYFGHMLLGLWVAWNARDRFGSILASGVVAVFFCHVCINLGGVLGLMPITGVTLPLMSYGGSSAVTLLLATGLLLSVSTHRRTR